MAKRKKKNSIIQDTSAGEMILDVTAKDSKVQSDSLMTTEAKLHPSESITFYMRMSKDLLDHVKQTARERSYNEQKDITYQMLIIEAVAKTYPLPREK